MMLETEKAYIAGLLDGEGHITIQTSYSGQKCMPIRIGISNNNLDLLSWVKERFGGTFMQRRDKCNTLKWGDKKSAENLLKAVLPYLILKKRQAEIMLAYLESVGEQGERNARSWEERLALKEELDSERARCNGKEVM
jgi:hypothetical protein